MSGSPAPLPIDTRVLIAGLVAEPKWNGKEGIIKGALSSGRYPVSVTTDEGEKVLNVLKSLECDASCRYDRRCVIN